MSNNQKYIIRADRAGVFYGEIAERRGSEIDLVNVRRIYSWCGACTLSQIATEGVGRGSKLTVVVPSMTVLGVIEVIPVSDVAMANLDGVAVWKS